MYPPYPKLLHLGVGGDGESESSLCNHAFGRAS